VCLPVCVRLSLSLCVSVCVQRMLLYLHTMRRLINLLATRERKAARLIRERWLTKAILERNSQRLRPVLEALLASVCKDRPDRLLDYATEWMRASYPEQAAEAAAAQCMCEWAPREDVEPTQEGLMMYLEETNVTAILEGIIERAIAAQPANVTAYVVDELVALNDTVRLRGMDGRDSDGDASESGTVRSSEFALDAEEDELLLDEEEQLLEEEELLVDDIDATDADDELTELARDAELDAELEAEIEAELLQHELDELDMASGDMPPGAFLLEHGPLATLEEEDDEEEDVDC